jgi:hypothetical protein
MLWIAMDPSVKARLDRASAENLCVACLQPFAKDEVADRGCHGRCAKATRRAIKEGIYTERQRIAEGKLLPVNIAGRPRTNPVSVEAAKLNASLESAVK